MTRVMTNRTANTRNLDAATTTRILTEAIDARAQLELYPDNAGLDAAYVGTLVGRSGACLTVELSDVGLSGSPVQVSSALQAALKLAGVQYTFQTKCMNTTSEAESGVIHVVTPKTMVLADRRRSPRRRLREPTSVTLYAAGAQTEWKGKATLLNLSPEGLACRLSKDRADALDIGDAVRVMFHLLGSSALFDLSSRIINITEGARPDHCVVGLEFIADDRLEANRSRLCEAAGITS